MESKSYVAALLIFAVAGLVNCAAADRKLRKITNRITTKMNNMEEDIKNMQLNIADLEFENQELRKELEGEKSRTSGLEIKLNSALTSSPAFPDIGAKDSTVQEKFQKIEGAINLLATDVAQFKSKSYKNTNKLEVEVRKAFMKEKAEIRKLNETLRREQKVATEDILDFIENANRSVERHLNDIGNLYDHEGAILEMTTKLDKIITSVGNSNIRISQNEKLLIEVSGKCSNLKTEDIENLYNTTSDHEEAILETTLKLDKIITAMGNTDRRISQNEKLLQMPDCGAHKEIPNGNVSGNSSVGGTPVISCNPGYSQTGSAQCKVPATWKTDVKCQKDCATLHVANGMVTPATTVPHGTIVTVMCNSGYADVGKNTAVCNNGDFTAIPSCRPIQLTDMVVGSLSSFLIKVYEDNSTPKITGAEFLSDGRLVLCDFYNNRIKLISKEFTMIDSLKLQARPWDVSAVNSSTVIVTLPFSKQLQYVHVVPQFKLSSNIQLDKKCLGVDVVDDEVFTSCFNSRSHEGEVRVYDLGGTLKRTLGVRQDNTYMFDSPIYLTVSTNSGNIYVSDVYTDKVTCLSSAGEVMYVYDDPELDYPTGIYVDDGGNTIVCGRDSYNIHLITAGGKKHSILLTSSDGIFWQFSSVAYRRSDATFVIGSWDNNNLLIFTLEN